MTSYLCGECKHWHPWKEEDQPYKCKQGDCDKVPKGTLFMCEDRVYKYDGYSFEDENYDDCFDCFEEAK